MNETGIILLIALLLFAAVAAMFVIVRRDKGDPLPSAEEVAHNPHVVEPLVAPIAGAPVVDPVTFEDMAPDPPPSPAAVPAAAADDLARMKGVGPKLLALFATDGIVRYSQIANWTEADIAAFETRNPGFKGRCARDKWVEQARLLAAGDIAGYEAAFGKL